MNRRRSPRFARLAVIGALMAAFALAGCGRKGPLEPPPVAGVAPQPAPAASPSQGIGLNPMPPREAPAAFDSEGHPVAPKGVKKPLPMDWLID